MVKEVKIQCPHCGASGWQNIDYDDLINSIEDNTGKSIDRWFCRVCDKDFYVESKRITVAIRKEL